MPWGSKKPTVFGDFSPFHERGHSLLFLFFWGWGLQVGHAQQLSARVNNLEDVQRQLANNLTNSRSSQGLRFAMQAYYQKI